MHAKRKTIIFMSSGNLIFARQARLQHSQKEAFLGRTGRTTRILWGYDRGRTKLFSGIG
jgi:hypothetical protein